MDVPQSSSSRPIPGRGDPSDVESQDASEATPWYVELQTGRGGPNSIDNFARSWQRAASFLSPIQKHPSFIYEHDSSSSTTNNDARNQHADLGEATPLLRDEPQTASAAAAVSPDDADALTPETSLGSLFRKRSSQAVVGGYGSSYGSLSSKVSESARQRAAELQRTPTNPDSAIMPKDDQPALTVKDVEQGDGTKVTVIVGHSTVPQTVFNSVNVLVGIGMLSLPLAFQYSGWFIGVILMIFSAIATVYTAKLLAKCLDVDTTLATYSDIAYISFGPRAQFIVSVLFCLELLGACVASVVLFADSIDALVPGHGVLTWKCVCGAMLIPLSFVPLHLLSLSSILGIFCCTSLLGILAIDGLLKPDAPGSLLQPAQTSFFPPNWNTVPLSIGLMLAPWGGHGVFPNIYKDMRHPHKYGKTLAYTFSFTWALDIAMGIVGWLMFGDAVRDEVTSNILLSDAYPHVLSLTLVAFIAIIPLTKVPLSSRPLVSTVVALVGLRPIEQGGRTMSARARAIGVGIVRVLVVVFFTVIAIVFPSFDRIMALMGASLCMIICIVFPVSFHLKIFGPKLGMKEWLANWILLVVGSVMGVLGTVYAFIPKEELGVH
ncbi:hypothetical protein KEM56_003381 [Ascosphaera pollenicola]|nr:hypothetical protein KEM56_003381 [Ascosphaera pollenicola]